MSEPKVEEVEAYLNRSAQRDGELPDDVQIARTPEAAIALEGGEATSGETARLTGWIFDPEDRIVGIWARIDGHLYPLTQIETSLRQDVLDGLGAAEGSEYQAGFFALSQCPRLGGITVAVSLVAVVRTSAGFKVVHSPRQLAIIPRSGTSDGAVDGDNDYSADLAPDVNVRAGQIAKFAIAAGIREEGEGNEEDVVASSAPSGEFPTHPTESEISTYLDTAARPRARGPDSILIGHKGNVAFALEGGAAVSGAFMDLQGWLFDPDNRVRSLWAKAGGDLSPVVRTAKSPRRDVLANLGASALKSGQMVGFIASGACPLAEGEDIKIDLAAVIESDTGYSIAFSSKVLSLKPGPTDSLAVSLSRLLNYPEDTLDQLSDSIIPTIVSDTSRAGWLDGEQEEITGTGDAAACLVVVVDRNAHALSQILSFIEMDPARDRLGVVLACRHPDNANEIWPLIRSLRGNCPFAFVKALIPSRTIGFGVAATEGVAQSGLDWIILASDTAVPPDRPWITRALALRDESGSKLFVPGVASYDGEPFGVGQLTGDFQLAHYRYSHAAALARARGCLDELHGFGLGVIVGSTSELRFGSGYANQGYCFADMLRRRQDGRLICTPIDDLKFTNIDLSPDGGANESEALSDLYVFAHSG